MRENSVNPSQLIISKELNDKSVCFEECIWRRYFAHETNLRHQRCNTLLPLHKFLKFTHILVDNVFVEVGDYSAESEQRCLEQVNVKRIFVHPR